MAPRTFYVKVDNQSINSKMLFQEKTTKEFLEGDQSTLLVLEEADALHFQTTVTSANVFVSVLEQDRT